MTNQPPPRLSEPIQRQLSAVRRLLRRYVLAQAALMAVCWLLVVFWLGGVLDYLPVRVGSNETPRWIRIAMLVVMGLGTLWILLFWMLPRLMVPARKRSIALLLERRYPELNNELLTAVELSEVRPTDVSNPTAYRAMLDRVHQSVSSAVSSVVPSELFNWQPIWGCGMAAVLGIVFTGIAAVGMPDWMRLWTQRLLALSDEPWPRRARLRADGIQLQQPTFSGQLSAQRVLIPFVDGLVRVPNGSAAMLHIAADTQAKQVPEVCTLFYRSSDGGRGRANLRRVGSPRQGWQQFTLDGPPLDGMSSDMVVDVVGLDARLRDLTLQVVDPIVIADMELQCSYPEYLLDSLSSRPQSEVIQYRSGMRIPQGTLVTLSGKASAKLSKIEYVVRQTGTDSSVDAELEIRHATPSDDEFTIPLGRLEASQVIEVRLTDEFGLSAEQIPSYIVTMQEDSIPEVDSRLEGIGVAVTPNAILPIRGTVKDDNAVAQVEAELALDDADSVSVPLKWDSDGNILSEIDLVQLAERQIISIAPGMTLGLVVSAQDHFDLGEQTHVGRGQPQQLAVVTQDALLIILDRQELELRKRLELIDLELEQVRDVLQVLASSRAADDETASARHSALRQLGLVTMQDAPAQDDPARGDASGQLRRMAMLRAQQSVLQSDKSQQELLGVATRVDNLRMQLVNNRIDSYDRQDRLQTKVREPLLELLAGDYELFRDALSELQTATMSGDGVEQAQSAVGALDRVLIALEAIQANMLDIESFNEIIDLVRGLLDDQDELLQDAQERQKQLILELLK